MKCPICGRDNPDIRLFCSRCGELLPESEPEADARQDVNVSEEADDDIKVYRRAGSRRISETAENADETGTPGGARRRFEPRIPTENAFSDDKDSSVSRDDDVDFFRRRERMRRVYEEAWPETTAPRAKERIFDGTEEMPRQGSENPFARPDASGGARRPPVLNRRDISDTGRTSTLIPKRDDLNVDNLFSVRGQIPAPMQPEPPKKRRGAEGEFEDAESQSFAMRHMRGIVAIILLLFSGAIVLAWAFTPDAQVTLARLDMAWSAEAYESLGLEAYNSGDYSSAGHYFTEALKCAGNNEGYAIYAANSYIEGGYTSKAIEALRNCIKIAPNKADYYITLMDICGGYDAMSDSDKALIAEGYRLTGDSRLDK